MNGSMVLALPARSPFRSADLRLFFHAEKLRRYELA